MSTEDRVQKRFEDEDLEHEDQYTQDDENDS